MKVFVEIGVGLFGTCHQLLENGWRGIMIEPLKEVCDKIVPHPNLSVENVAISTEQGTEILLRVKDENVFKESEKVKVYCPDCWKDVTAWAEDFEKTGNQNV